MCGGHCVCACRSCAPPLDVLPLVCACLRLPRRHAAVATTARNYAADRGLAMGLTKALYGLSASMLTLVYVCTYRPDVTPFIMFCAISITTFGVVGAVFNRLMPKSLSASMRRPERARMLLGYVLIFVLMLYLGIMGSLTAEGTLERAGRYAYGLIPFILLLSLSAVPITCRKQQHPSNSTLHVVNTASHKHEYLSIPSTATQRLVDGGGVNAAPSTSPLRDSLLAPPTAEGDAALSEGPHPSHRLSFAPEVLPSVSGATLLEAVSSLDFALLTAIFFLSTGAGLTLINNLGSMTQALGAQRDDQDVYVNLLSIFNCLGRLCTGSASDALLPRFPRPIWLAGCCALLAVGMAMVAVGNLDLLYPAVMCAGTC
ncbi:MAG: hypothetical protein EOO41_01210 [Methanobacteriota archaeon]|nr:MAG: hypothetical protein EOO41_01210 [Euryarchaeota archaeon]